MDNLVYFAFECVVILKVSTYALSDSSLNCYNKYCFTYPGADVALSFDGAMDWCTKNDSSTLAAVNNEDTHDALTKFLLQLHNSSTLYINAKLDNMNGNTWYFVNGEHFTGNVQNQTGQKDSQYQFYTSLRQWQQTFDVLASSPQELQNYICQYKNDSGLSILKHTNYSHNGSIYVKYENETVNWFEARNRCYLKGGDLATFFNLSTFNTSWLNPSSSYWIGIRWNNRCWKTTGDNEEIKYTRWSSGYPSSSSSGCICIHKDSSWNWSDCDCSSQRSFVCVKYISNSNTNSATTNVISAASSQKEENVNRTPEYSNTLAIGLGVGLGGGVLVIIIVIVVVVIAIKKRKRKQLPTVSNKTKEEGKPGKKPRSPKDPKVIKQSDNLAVYADIVSFAQPIVSEPTKTPIVYVNPEFVGNTASERLIKATTIQ